MIDALKLQDIFLDSLFREEEIEDGKPKSGLDFVECHGIIINVAFHKERLISHKEDVKSFLCELNPNFSKGLSFLEMSLDKDGNQWGEHRNAEQLILLGYGLGYISYLIPKVLWSQLPGGVPFIVVHFDKMDNVAINKAKKWR